VSVYFQGLVRSLASVWFHGLLTEVCTIMCLGVKRHLVSGREISRLQHGLQFIMARCSRIINCRPCCNLYLRVESAALAYTLWLDTRQYVLDARLQQSYTACMCV